MTKSKITQYTLPEFLLMTVEIVYRNHDKTYSVSVPNEHTRVRGKTLTRDEKEQLYNKLQVTNP